MPKCSKCSVTLYIHQPSGEATGFAVMDGESFQDKFNRQPRACQKCHKNYCSHCTYTNGNYVCPICGQHIGTLGDQPTLIAGKLPARNTQASAEYSSTHEAFISKKITAGKKVCVMCNHDITDETIQCSNCGSSRFAYISDNTSAIDTARDQRVPASPIIEKKWWKFWK